MDTGNAHGDLFFYLAEFLLPLECADTSSFPNKFDCTNPERRDPNLVVTKVDMEVDSRYTKYSGCNLCNGTDPFTHKNCTIGTYVCDCLNFGGGGNCDATKLGFENVSENFVRQTTPACEQAVEDTCGPYQKSKKHCSLCTLRHSEKFKKVNCTSFDLLGFCPNPFGGGWCSARSQPYECWRENIPRKTGGLWYSQMREGMCNSSSPVGSCGWKVLSTSTVHERCLKNSIVREVEETSPDCFQTCGPRNETSSCWISCFFDTVLGPSARNSTVVQGMPMDRVVESWKRAFHPVIRGGCQQLGDEEESQEALVI
ncbi:unnamed protein product [Polarella glacialis]|uniref:Uncharacterized protein n=1 Tax=Polarella glacialis TaxID=89957 RepID=A0A813DZY4_POLGL|nr:unnamed protein product [Polarella glacialis]